MDNQIKFSDESIVDSFGRVFFFEGRVFRLINSSSISNCYDLLNSDLIKELEQKDLIPKTIISDLDFGFKDALVLEHEKCLDTKPHEWSFQMYKEAAKLVLKLNQICEKYGYELKDAHPHNILFRFNKPIFIDIGSIQKKIGERWVAEEEFLKTFYIPLLLWQKGEYYLLRLILESDFYQRVIPNQDVLNAYSISKLISSLEYYEIKKSFFKMKVKSKFVKSLFDISNKIIQFFFRKRRNYSFFKIKTRYNDVNMDLLDDVTKYKKNSMWQEYHTDFFQNDNSLSYSRFDKILVLIKEYCIGCHSVIDLAGNQGAFSILLEKNKMFSSITMADYDENAIDLAFENLNKIGSKINPVLLNFMVPVDLLTTTKRLQADVVVALAVTHHLILTQRFSISAIFERLKMYSKKYVIVEFMPLGLWDGTETENNLPEIPDWYNLNWFTENFKLFFSIQYVEQLEKNRIIFIGEKLSC